MKKIMSIIMAFLFTASFLNWAGASEAAAESQDLLQERLNSLEAYEDALNEELAWLDEMVKESDAWAENSQELKASDYVWITEAREAIIQYFDITYQKDISWQVNAIRLCSAQLPAPLGGFSDGSGTVYFSEDDLSKDRMRDVCVHEMIHALGVDYYNDASGMRSNAFFEGYTETVTKEVLLASHYEYHNASSYNEIAGYGEKFLKSDPDYLPELIGEEQHDIAGRVDEVLGEGVGESLLNAEMLLESGEDAKIIFENCELIAEEYAEAVREERKRND